LISLFFTSSILDIGETSDEEGSGFSTRAVTEKCCQKIRISFHDADVCSKQEGRQGAYDLTTYNHNNKAEYHQEGGIDIIYFYRNLGGILAETITLRASSQTLPQTALWNKPSGGTGLGVTWHQLEDGKVFEM
jgi:hypothetical protein